MREKIMSDYTLNLTPSVYQYLLQNSLREPDVLQKLRAQTQTMSTRKMQISPEQGQFMQLLVQILNAKKTLEIGVFTGYSALAVALALPSDGKVVACDLNVEWTKIAKRFWEEAGVADKIDLRLAPALDTLQNLLDQGEAGTFDFVFIDADKKNYSAYYEKSLALIRVGGLIAVDNVLWDCDVADSAINDENTIAIRELNTKIHTDERVTLSMLPIGDGLTLARKKP
jgi:predicted O-methyltransferase YrrM